MVPEGRTFFVHPQALCDSRSVGEGTRVWAFAHVLEGARIGTGCNICDHVFIENDVVLGNDVTVKCGVQLWDGIEVGSGVFIGPNATFTNDRFPRSKVYPDAYLKTIIEDDVSIGANATILPGLRIGRGAMVGAGSVVTHNVPPYATVVGNPAVIIGYSDPATHRLPNAPKIIPATEPKPGVRTELGVGDCWVEHLPQFQDIRGAITQMEIDGELPFSPKRILLFYDAPNKNVRTEYARRTCQQFMVAVRGRLSIILDDGRNRKEVQLEGAPVGVYLAPMVWITRFNVQPDTVLLAAESQSFDPNDCIFDYETYRALKGARNP